MIRTRIAQAAAVAAVSLTALLVTPDAATAATNGAPQGSATAASTDSISWGGVVAPASISWGG
ncbi:hypothetical protein [Kitasatospora sp. NPDC101183]|uniref:hypothetical protein n=1 Tax=Kitasatospora sp. NPDC101183 TaxID=3364100 RepID=UPI003822EC82